MLIICAEIDVSGAEIDICGAALASLHISGAEIDSPLSPAPPAVSPEGRVDFPLGSLRPYVALKHLSQGFHLRGDVGVERGLGVADRLCRLAPRPAGVLLDSAFLICLPHVYPSLFDMRVPSNITLVPSNFAEKIPSILTRPSKSPLYSDAARGFLALRAVYRARDAEARVVVQEHSICGGRRCTLAHRLVRRGYRGTFSRCECWPKGVWFGVYPRSSSRPRGGPTRTQVSPGGSNADRTRRLLMTAPF